MHKSKIILCFIISTGFITCSQKKLHEDKLIFSKTYRDFLNPYALGDTIIFRNNKHRYNRLVVTKIDSTLVNPNESDTIGRPYKEITVYYTALSKITSLSDFKEHRLVSIHKFGDSGSEGYYITFENLHGRIYNGNDTLFTDLMSIGDFKFTNYYKVNNVNVDRVNDSSNISTAYVDSKVGIIAYRDQHGNWWTRVQ